jgi:hypothetical protein
MGGTVGNTGTINLAQTVLGAGPVEVVVAGASATFAPALQIVPSDPCTTTTINECIRVTCPLTGVMSQPTPAAVTHLDAGMVTVGGLLQEITLERDEATGDYEASAFTRYWMGGESATLEVTGSEQVPAFTAELVVPSDVTISSPVPGGNGMYSVSLGEDLVLEWEGEGAGSVSLGLSDAGSSTTTFSSISCLAPASFGSLSVNQPLLEGLGASGVINVQLLSTMTQDVDDWTIHFTAATSGVASGPVQFTP